MYSQTLGDEMLAGSNRVSAVAERQQNGSREDVTRETGSMASMAKPCSPHSGAAVERRHENGTSIPAAGGSKEGISSPLHS